MHRPIRFTVATLRQPLQRLIAVALAVLLLPFAQIDALSQQQGYPQYPNNQYAQPAPNYDPPPPQQPYQDPSQYQYADRGQLGGAPQWADPNLAPAQQQAFGPEQLEQLAAPIALYPDTLVAQVLAAATYPAQVVAADQWLRAQGYAAPEEIASAADAQSSWDPSVKALTAFPQVLAMMDRDLQWTTDLGNAYYNQPQDVLQTIQVLRQRAENAGTLQTTPQEQVDYHQGYIELAPPNPQVVYVPAYNPWYAYGAPIAPYPGFSLLNAFGAIGSVLGPGLRFGAGIALAAFTHTSFGWMGWALNWLASSIFFHQSPYYSHSTSVAHFANPGGYGGRGRGYPTRPMPENRGYSAYAHPQSEINRPSNGYRGQDYARPSGNGYVSQGYARQETRSYGAENFARPDSRGAQSYAYNRPPAPPASGYGNSYARPESTYGYNSRPQVQAAIPPRAYSQYPNPQQAWHPAQPAVPRGFAGNSFTNRSSAPESRSTTAYAAPRNFAESSRSAERGGGFHAFGGRGESYRAPKAPKAPKSSGGGLFHRSGGGKRR